MRRGFTLKELSIVFTVIVLVLGIFASFDTFVTVFFGWLYFGSRVANEMTVDWLSILSAVVALSLFWIGLHKFCGWLYRNTGVQNEERRWKLAWSNGIVSGIVLMFCAGTASIAVVHQFNWLFSSKTPVFVGGREPYHRHHSRSNLKQIGIAMHDYHAAFNSFPAGGTFDLTGRPLHSWVTQTLPYWQPNDRPQLSDQIQHDVPWDDPRNAQPLQQQFMMLINPGIVGGPFAYDEPTDFDANQYALSHYAANILVIGPRGPLRIKDITDGTSNTFMAGEVNANFRPWGDPFNFRDLALGINHSPDGFGSPFQGGAYLLRVDGSAQFISEDVDIDLLKAPATPAGGEAETIPGGLVD